MIYKSILEDQIEAKKKESELRQLRLKEEDLKDLERIHKENDKLERRRLKEDQLIKDREDRMRKFNKDQRGGKTTNLNKIPTVESKFLSNPGNEGGNQYRKMFRPDGNNFNQNNQQNSRFQNSPQRVHLSQIKEQIVKDEIQREVDQAKSDMTYHKNEVKRDLHHELRREKEFLETLPEEIRKKIQATMDVELHRLKNEVNHGTNILRDEIIKLRSQAVELDQEKKEATRDLHKLRENLAKIQYNDDIRTHELLNALAEDNLYKILPSSSKYTMPEALFVDNKQSDFPISYYDKDRVIKGEAKLYTDGYFSNGAKLTDPLYQSLNFDNRKGARIGNSGVRGYDVDAKTERLYHKNSERDNVYGSILDNQKMWSLEEYLKRDLADPVNISF